MSAGGEDDLSNEGAARAASQKMIMDKVIELAAGNPGAIRVLGELMNRGHELFSIPEPPIPPAMGFIGLIDRLGLVGPRLWVLYKDRCGMNIARLAAVICAYAVGRMSRDEIRDLTDDRLPAPDFDALALHAHMRERLAGFDLQNIGGS